MKSKIIILIAISLLLQSCHSYRTINPSNCYLEVGKHYKIKQQTDFERVKLRSFTDSTITVINGNREQEISKKNIKKMKEREFSSGKTVVLVVPTALTLILTLVFQNRRFTY